MDRDGAGRLRRAAHACGQPGGQHPGDRVGRKQKTSYLYDGLTAGEADAVLAASIFHYGTHDPPVQGVPDGARRAWSDSDARREAFQ
jgi:hypothetical protein